jgi:antitoxin (DNA-binding transcriptional repressor) of toxin-antitoxin stability system
MELRITATELARKLGDVLGKIRYRGETFIIERNGEPVARIGPIPALTAASIMEGFRAWVEAGPGDTAFADDLERVARADRPPPNPWA